MMNKRKGILNTIFLISIFAITMYYVFHGQDMNSILKYLKHADVRYWILAVVCVIFFIGSEAIIFYYMMRNIKYKIRFIRCFLYSCVGFFFSCITPSASGGQPAQLYYMKKDKIPIPLATLILMIVTITYKLVLVIIGIAVFVFRPVEIMHYLNPVIGICYLGLFLNILCVVIMALLVFHPTMAQNILILIVKMLHKIHLVKRTNYYLEKIEHAMKQYKDVALFFRTHKLLVFNVLIITFIQRVLLFYVTYLTYRSFGLNGIGVVTIVVLQGMISVAVEMLPLPGGMGISEKLFLMIFTPLFGSITLPAMVISRGLSYYTQLIICALIMMAAYFIIGREREGDKVK